MPEDAALKCLERSNSNPRFLLPTMKKWLSLSVMAIVALGMSSRAAKAQDIVDIASGNPDFSTLVTAVKAAGLVDTLKSAGPFTVFAPTNKAFAKIPRATLEALLKNKKADLPSYQKYWY